MLIHKTGNSHSQILKSFLTKQALMSTIPIDLDTIDQEDLDREILRLSIIAELDAVNLYEQMANKTSNSALKTILLDVAKEEKTHVGEFQALLEKIDKEHSRELDKGEKEVEEKI